MITQSIDIKNIIICVIHIIIFIIIKCMNIKNIIICVINIIIFIIINKIINKCFKNIIINIKKYYFCIINFYNIFYKNKRWVSRVAQTSN
jgi:hypothetical protein